MVSSNSSKPKYFMCSSFRSTATQEYQKNRKKGGRQDDSPTKPSNLRGGASIYSHYLYKINPKPKTVCAENKISAKTLV